MSSGFRLPIRSGARHGSRPLSELEMRNSRTPKPKICACGSSRRPHPWPRAESCARPPPERRLVSAPGETRGAQPPARSLGLVRGLVQPARGFPLGKHALVVEHLEIGQAVEPEVAYFRRSQRFVDPVNDDHEPSAYRGKDVGPVPTVVIEVEAP